MIWTFCLIICITEIVLKKFKYDRTFYQLYIRQMGY